MVYYNSYKCNNDVIRNDPQDVTEVPHELDVQYETLHANLTHLNPKSHEYQVVSKYMTATSGQWRKIKLLDVWGVDRQGVVSIHKYQHTSSKTLFSYPSHFLSNLFFVPPFLLSQDISFREYDEITNRRLLWHGTNVAVVAAILKSGLRIMPHSGGRVGKGIYLASENSKSAGYGECLLIIVKNFYFCYKSSL